MQAVRRLQLVLAVLAASCASPSGGSGAQSQGAGALPVGKVPVPDAVRPLFLTIYPEPRKAEYGEVLLPLDTAVRMDDLDPRFDQRLRELGLDVGWKQLARE